MGAPKVRVAALRDPDDMRGLAYVPELLVYELTAPTDKGAYVLAEFSEAVLVKRADLWVETAFGGTSPTLEIGTDTNNDALIDTADYNEEAADAYATNVGSSNADNPAGLMLADGDSLHATFGGSPNGTGKAVVVLEIFRMAEFQSSPNYAFTNTDNIS